LSNATAINISLSSIYFGTTTTPAVLVNSTPAYIKAVGVYKDFLLGVSRNTPLKGRAIDGALTAKTRTEEAASPFDADNDERQDRFVIGANDIELRTAQAAAVAAQGNAGIINATKAEAWKLLKKDIEGKNVRIVSIIKDYQPATFSSIGGTYRVTFAVDDPDAVKNSQREPLTTFVDIRVISGKPPVITPGGILALPETATSQIVTRGQLMSGVQAHDPDEGDVRSKVTMTYAMLANSGQDRVSISAIDQNVMGTYIVTYRVTDEDGNEAMPQDRVVVVGPIVVDPDGFAYYARDYVKYRLDITGTDDEIIRESAAYAVTSKGALLNVAVVTKGAYRAQAPAGNYPIELTVVGKTLAAAPWRITAISTNVPDPVVGTKYAIGASDARLNIGAANGLTAANMTSRLAASCGVQIWRLLPSAATSGAIIVDDGGMSAKLGRFAEGDTFRVTFAVEREPGTKVTKTVRISQAGRPWLTVSPSIMIPLNSTYDPRQAIQSAGDAEDYWLGTGSVQIYVASGSAPLNTAVPGVYRYNYVLSDSDGNVTSAGPHTIFVGNWTVIGDYAIYAEDYTVAASVATGTNAEILTRSRAQAFKLSTGSYVPVVVTDNVGYKRLVGTYKGIRIAVQENTAVRTSINATITGYIYTVTFDVNGGRLADVSTKQVLEPNRTIDSLPRSPTRTNYTFTGWNTLANGRGSSFTASTVVTGNIRVYAQWNRIPVPEPDEPDPVPTPPAPVTPPPTVIVNNVPGETPPPEVVTVPTIVYVPTETAIVPEEQPPLTPPVIPEPEPVAGWSLIDLICALLSLVLTAVLISTYFRRKDRGMGQAFVDGGKGGAYRGTVSVLRIISIVGGVFSLVLLLITQRFSEGMQMVDANTWIFAVIAVVQFISTVLVLTGNRPDDMEVLD
ncbi:MAG: InlB B-repeat-containing protein, partial [Clostridiales Family XIII bacterium]|nr:InlB B-repeat-containing protein [Clostridiales Family XIII bacterium]